MKKYDQDVFHDAEHGVFGNCFATCLRCILELNGPIENFCAHDDWFIRVEHFLRGYGFAYVPIEISTDSYLWKILGYHVIGGDGPRGIRHAVVGFQGKIAWDPHPSRKGLLGSLDNGWSIGILVYRGDEKLVVPTTHESTNDVYQTQHP